MSNFPLYDTLNVDIPTIDLTNKQKDAFLRNVKLLDVDGMERLYVIIRIHQLENSEDKSSYIIPYKGKFVKSDLKFDLDELPTDLKHILFKFVTIHRKTMEENSNLHNPEADKSQTDDKPKPSPKPKTKTDKPKPSPKPKTDKPKPSPKTKTDKTKIVKQPSLTQ